MKSILLLLFIWPFLSVRANTYYFSSNYGDDSRSFSQAQNSSTPWRSLSKLNSIFGSLKPGDKVLLKRGDVFYGSIIVTKSGKPGSPIVIGAYGSGSKPLITSLVRLNNWVSKGNGIYESYHSDLPSKVNIVLMNGVEQEMGRYPNSDDPGKGYLHYDSYGSNYIYDNGLSGSTNWKGADVVIRLRRWVLDRNLITGQSGKRISFKSASYYRINNDNQGYFITNSIKTLDKKGEWYYNPSTKKLSIYLGSNSPSSYSIQASVQDELIHTEFKSNIIFDNLIIKGANSSGISIKFGKNIQITNCDVQFSGINGVSAIFHPNFKIENSTISNSNNIGLELGYTGDNAIIRNNKIVNTAPFAGMMGSGDGAGIGIHCNGNNTLVEYNQIINTGYIGLVFNGNGTIIKNNYVDRFCTIKDDGSGIYAWSPSKARMKNRKVIGNIVVNGIGESQGTRWPTLNDVAEGIYMDNNSSGVEIRDNTVGNCSNQSIYFNNTSNIILKNNTFYSGRRQITLRETINNRGKLRNCLISNNILFATAPKQALLYRESPHNDIRMFGKFSNNYYARPKDNQTDKFLKRIRNAEPGAKLLSVENPVRFEYNATKQAKTIKLDGSYVDVRNNRYSNRVTLDPFTSVILIKTGPASSNESPTVSITNPAANAVFQAGTTLNIGAKAADADGSISKVEFYRGSTLLGTRYDAPYTYSWQNIQAGYYTLTAKATDNSGNVTTSGEVTISVTSSSSFPTVSLTSPSDNATYNDGASVNLFANASDPDGSIQKVEFYSGSYLLHTVTRYPYNYTWKNVSAGSYRLTAKAVDNRGNVTTSNSVSITVRSSSSNSYPRVSITNPVQNRRYKAGSTIDIRANASVAEGRIKRVEYYVNGNLIHTERGRPYSWNWRRIRAGSYRLTARAIDNYGRYGTSENVYIYVTKTSSRDSDINDASVDVNNSDSSGLEMAMLEKPETGSFDFRLYPNPAVNTITVALDQAKVNQKANLSIINMNGSIVKNLPLVLSGKTVDLDISSLNAGTYVVRITGDNFTVNKKFIKIGK
jgi:parallel beta-helix repeat protein